MAFAALAEVPQKSCIQPVPSDGRRHCGGEPLRSAGAVSEAECQGRCELDPLCQYFSFWTTQWCVLSAECDSLWVDTNLPPLESISIQSCSRSTQLRPAPVQKSCDSPVTTDGSRHCGGEPLRSAGAASEAECQGRCELDPLCQYFSFWTMQWCVLSAECDSLWVDTNLPPLESISIKSCSSQPTPSVLSPQVPPSPMATPPPPMRPLISPPPDSPPLLCSSLAGRTLTPDGRPCSKQPHPSNDCESLYFQRDLIVELCHNPASGGRSCVASKRIRDCSLLPSSPPSPPSPWSPLPLPPSPLLQLPPPPQFYTKSCSAALITNARSYCADTPIAEDFVRWESCQSKCEADDYCRYFSVWSTGWCRLTATCDKVWLDNINPVELTVDLVACTFLELLPSHSPAPLSPSPLSRSPPSAPPSLLPPLPLPSSPLLPLPSPKPPPAWPPPPPSTSPSPPPPSASPSPPTPSASPSTLIAVGGDHNRART